MYQYQVLISLKEIINRFFLNSQWFIHFFLRNIQRELQTDKYHFIRITEAI